MREIEIKCTLDNRDAVIKKIESLGVILSHDISQIDEIYLKKNDSNLLELSEGSSVLRIRKENKKYEITLKIHNSNELDCSEETLNINDPYAAKRFFELLGYVKVIRVSKNRKIGCFNNFNICIDNVKGLGDFIEIEKLLPDTEEISASEIKTELENFVKTLGVSRDCLIDKGYDTLLYIKNDL